jgi:hypothetical protein
VDPDQGREDQEGADQRPGADAPGGARHPAPRPLYPGVPMSY